MPNFEFDKLKSAGEEEGRGKEEEDLGGIEEEGGRKEGAGKTFDKVTENKSEGGGMEEGMMEDGRRMDDGEGETNGEWFGRRDGVEFVGGRRS